jgi:hypothetical protein
LKQGQKTWYFNSVWNFWHNIQIDDIVIARRGTKQIAAVGKVIRTAFYNKKMGKDRMPDRSENFYTYFISLEWMNDKKDITFEKPVFPLKTIWEIAESKYKEFHEGASSKTQQRN